MSIVSGQKCWRRTGYSLQRGVQPSGVFHATRRLDDFPISATSMTIHSALLCSSTSFVSYFQRHYGWDYPWLSRQQAYFLPSDELKYDLNFHDRHEQKQYAFFSVIRSLTIIGMRTGYPKIFDTPALVETSQNSSKQNSFTFRLFYSDHLSWC